jgi:hypothetical protein
MPVTSILASYDVDSPEHGKPFKIDIVEGLGPTHIDYIEQSWRPVMDRQHDLAILQYFLLPVALRTDDSYRDILNKLGIPDRHWDWRLKCTVAAKTNRKVYGLLNGEHVEGAMLLEFGHTARCAPGLPLLYVDLVAAAPWNRSAIQRPERFRGMGTLMLGVAVEVSRVHSFDGRCGLHSLLAAEGFYRRIGMKEFGIDPSKEGMRYFELDASAAKAFTG